MVPFVAMKTLTLLAVALALSGCHVGRFQVFATPDGTFLQDTMHGQTRIACKNKDGEHGWCEHVNYDEIVVTPRAAPKSAPTN
jgi:hypothetical protein